MLDNRIAAMLACSSCMAIAMTGSALAQSHGPSLAGPIAGDIIVTARRVEECLQDVPISITVFDQQQLTNRNIISALDLGTYTPPLRANSRYSTENASFSIRDFTQELRTQPSVAVYFADVVAPRGGGTTQSGDGAGPGSFFDLQNVQVLKGPQGTLFGRNTTGGTNIRADQALDHVAGYAIGLDMTMQGEEFPSFGKSFDTYGVTGPWMVTADEIPDPSVLNFSLRVDGELRQQDSVGRLVLDVPHLIEHVASIMTFHPGDVIFSGTPPTSIGPVVPGDVMQAQMDMIGEMIVHVSGGPGRAAPSE